MQALAMFSGVSGIGSGMPRSIGRPLGFLVLLFSLDAVGEDLPFFISFSPLIIIPHGGGKT